LDPLLTLDALDSVELDGDVHIKMDGHDEEEEDEEEKDEMKQDTEQEVVVVDVEEEEDRDEDDGKEPQTIGQGEMVHTLADDVDTMVDDQPIVLPEQGQEMCENTPRPQPLAAAPWPQNTDPRRRLRTLETHPLSGMEYLGLMTRQKPRSAVPTQRESEAAGNTSDVDVHQQLMIQSAGGDSLPNAPRPDVSLLNIPLPDVLLSEVGPDGAVGEACTCHRVAKEEKVVVFWLGSLSCVVGFLCSNLFILSIDYYTRLEIFGPFKVYFIYMFCIGFILLVLFYS
jgi:hypothetical protein